MPKPVILVTGGAGFIGSHVTKLLAKRGFQTVAFDNLSTGRKEAVKHGDLIIGDLSCQDEIEAVFKKFNILAVMHFAGVIDVGESFVDPLKYYHNNVSCTINLAKAMQKFDVKTIIFSSSAGIFGLANQVAIDETHPLNPISPYGESKLMAEKILHAIDLSFGIKSSCLRYFNAAGGDSEGEIKNTKAVDTNLIPLVLRSLKTPAKPIVVYGLDYPTPDGTCIRDYIHVEDLAEAHLLALEKLLENRVSTEYNLGNGEGFSILEIIQAVETATQLKVNWVAGSRRKGDAPRLVADSKKARTLLGWEPRYKNINEIVQHAWIALN